MLNVPIHIIYIIENDFSKEDAVDENNDISIGESEDSENNSSGLPYKCS